MNKKIKKLWLDRLRSSKDKQSRGRMRNFRNEFCPIGILCDIIDSQSWIQNGSIWYHRGMIHSPAESVLSDSGLSRPELVAIYYWNDKDKLTLPQISDKIEELY